MDTQKLDGRLYARMVQYGSGELYSNRQIVNDLNVFPIPDGDTGDNMYMTINSGAESLPGDETDLSSVAAKASSGMFMGARGNSGVILSRIFKGISTGLEGKQEVDIKGFAKALESGIEESYKAVSKPVEGTILTVYREAVRQTTAEMGEDATFESYFSTLLSSMQRSLENTPNLLEVLHQAGVVDSGGAGLLYIIQGMSNAILGKEQKTSSRISDTRKTSTVDLSRFNEDSELTYGYCTEFTLQLMTAKIGDVAAFDEKIIFDYLNSVGESVVAFRDGSLVRVHIHTSTPGEILNHCQRWGEFLMLKIENMTVQHNETTIRNNFMVRKPRKKFAIVTVAAGEGVCRLFNDLGVDFVIDGGQSMNPSVKDFMDAFDTLEAENIIVFPNNGNVILTARQIAEVYDKANIVVIPNTSLGTGYSAIASLDTEGKELDELLEAVNANMEGVVTAAVSRANRDADQDGIHITHGHYIGFADDVVYVDSSVRKEAALVLADRLGVDDYGILILIKGKDTPESEAQKLAEELEEKYRLTDIIYVDGEQPIHDYIMILEQ